MMAFALRILVILFGYILASAATGFIVYAALRLFPSGGFGQDASRNGFIFSYMVTLFVMYFAAVPASLVIAWGEFRAWRMWWYYAIAGSLIGLGLGYGFSPPWWFPWLGLSIGPISGLIYWGIAGRKAGLAEAYPRNAIVATFIAIAVIIAFLSWGPADCWIP